MSDFLPTAVGIIGALAAAGSAVAAALSARWAAHTYRAMLDANRAQEVQRVSLLAADCQIQADRVGNMVVECLTAFKAAEIFSGSSNNSSIALAVAEVENKGARARALADTAKAATSAIRAPAAPTPDESIETQIQVAAAHCEIQAIREDIRNELQIVRDQNAEHRRLRLAKMYRPQESNP